MNRADVTKLLALTAISSLNDKNVGIVLPSKQDCAAFRNEFGARLRELPDWAYPTIVRDNVRVIEFNLLRIHFLYNSIDFKGQTFNVVFKSARLSEDQLRTLDENLCFQMLSATGAAILEFDDE